jgi:hypothetical protein
LAEGVFCVLGGVVNKFPFGVTETSPLDLETAMYYGKQSPGEETYMVTTVSVSILSRGRIFEIMKLARFRFAMLVVNPELEKLTWGNRRYHLHVKGPAWQVLLFHEALSKYRRDR